MTGMISVEQALARIDTETRKLDAEACPISEAHGRVLAETLLAQHDSPPFDTSAMDGFAVKASDLDEATKENPVELKLQGSISAGDRAPKRLGLLHALKINTGAPFPSSANAVVPVEKAEAGPRTVRFFEPVEKNAAIRRAGEDYMLGTEMMSPGRRLDPAALGLAASLGCGEVQVSKRPRVALLSTGDELVEPGEHLGFGQIYDSSRVALAAMVRAAGADVMDLGRTTDDAETTKSKLSEGLQYDVLVTTGGVSMGDRDLIRPTLLELGAQELFWKVAQRPGKPLFLAKAENTLCFGLPGNPVSVFVTALVYLRRTLLKMQGAADIELPWEKAEAGDEFKKPVNLTTFSRARIERGEDSGWVARKPLRVYPHAAQGSHQFSALSQADGIVWLPENLDKAGKGQAVDFLNFRGLFDR